MNSLTLTGISSMATRQVLHTLALQWQQHSRVPLLIESLGGVDAAKRVEAGEAFDLVFLARDALLRLEKQGHVKTASMVPLMRSGVGVAVAEHAEVPAFDDEAAVRRCVESVGRIGYSTGPSGAALLALLDRWGLRQSLEGRLVQAQPGIPVAQLVAQGDVEIGFQQLSELLHVEGIQIVGLLPEAIKIETIFCGALTQQCQDPQRVRLAMDVLKFMASDEANPIRLAQGMSAP